MRIAVLALSDVFDTGLSTVLDTFDVANALTPAAGLGGTRFDVTLAGVRRAVRTAQWLGAPVTPAARLRAPDVAIVPALGAKMSATLGEALTRGDVRDAGAQLRQWTGRGATLAAACTGTFVLAEAGLLDGHPAATSWWLGPCFRERYPRVALDETRMLVLAPHRLTAGAAIAHLDLALAIVRSTSPALADVAARYLVTDARPSQAPFIIPHHLAHDDPVISRFEHWVRARLDQRCSLARAARGTGTSERTHALAPGACRARPVSVVVRPGSAGGTRRPLATHDAGVRRSNRNGSGVCGWRHVANADSAEDGPRCSGDSAIELVSCATSRETAQRRRRLARLGFENYLEPPPSSVAFPLGWSSWSPGGEAEIGPRSITPS